MRKIQLCLDVADTVSEYATCRKRKVGCVLTDDEYRIISTGYNGVPSGVKHCTDHPCPGAGTKQGSNKCMALHAEQNAIARARSKPTYAFVTVKPCEHCLKQLIAAGVKTIHYYEDYESPNELYNLVELIKHERTGIFKPRS